MLKGEIHAIWESEGIERAQTLASSTVHKVGYESTCDIAPTRCFLEDVARIASTYVPKPKLPLSLMM